MPQGKALTTRQKKKIKEYYLKTGASYQEIGDMRGVAASTIGSVLRFVGNFHLR